MTKYCDVVQVTQYAVDANVRVEVTAQDRAHVKSFPPHSAADMTVRTSQAVW